MFPRFARCVLAAAVLAVSTLSAGAAVVTEADGQFSKHWKKPTEIGFGADTVLGTAEKQNSHEYLVFTALAPGAQTLTFAFTVPEWARQSYPYSAGGQVLWSADPFRWNWDGETAGSFQLSRWNPQQSFDMVLGDDFGGSLYLGVYFTHGQDVAWSLSAPGNAPAPVVSAPERVVSTPEQSSPFTPSEDDAPVSIADPVLAAPAPAPIPLPAGIWLMFGSLALIGIVGARRRPEVAARRA